MGKLIKNGYEYVLLIVSLPIKISPTIIKIEKPIKNIVGAQIPIVLIQMHEINMNVDK